MSIRPVIVRTLITACVGVAAAAAVVTAWQPDPDLSDPGVSTPYCEDVPAGTYPCIPRAGGSTSSVIGGTLHRGCVIVYLSADEGATRCTDGHRLVWP